MVSYHFFHKKNELCDMFNSAVTCHIEVFSSFKHSVAIKADRQDNENYHCLFTCCSDFKSYILAICNDCTNILIPSNSVNIRDASLHIDLCITHLHRKS